MAQFVLKIEKLSYTVEIAPILEMARAYGLRPRLWLLILYVQEHDFESPCFGMLTVGTTIFHWLYFDRIW